MLEKTAHTMTKPVLLWIEDDLKYARLLEMELGSAFEFRVHTELTSQLLGELQEKSSYSSVIIDMHLQKGRKGPEDCKRIRDSGYTGPIFVLSNDETALSKIEMLSLGVDDYLWKVMPTEELSLRIHNAIRRYSEASAKAQNSNRVSFSGLEIHLDRLTATLHEAPLELSKIELRILLTLFRHHPQPTPIRTLKQEAWENTVVEDGTLNTFFWKLNKKTASWTYRVVKSGDEVSLQESTKS